MNWKPIQITIAEKGTIVSLSSSLKGFALIQPHVLVDKRNTPTTSEVKVNNGEAVDVTVVDNGARVPGSMCNSDTTVPQTFLDASLCRWLVLGEILLFRKFFVNQRTLFLG